MPGLADALLNVQSVQLEPGQTRLQNVGTIAVGEYGDDDLLTLQEMMRSSLSNTNTGPGAFQIHVVVRRFLVAHSNNAGLAIACVGWALTDATGTPVFHEQFYASDYVRTFGTLGGIKNHVHQGITRHVLGQAARVARGELPAPVSGDYVYSTYEAASAKLPASLTSVHLSIGTFGVGYSWSMTTYTGDSGHGWVREPDQRSSNALHDGFPHAWTGDIEDSLGARTSVSQQGRRPAPLLPKASLWWLLPQSSSGVSSESSASR